jgi:hypothetical protein
MNLATSVQFDITDYLCVLGISNFVTIPQVCNSCSLLEFAADSCIEKLAVVGDPSRYACLLTRASMLTAIGGRAPSLKASLSYPSLETVTYA